MPTRSDNIWEEPPNKALLKPIRHTLDVAENQPNPKLKAGLLRQVAKIASEIAEKLDPSAKKVE